MFTNLWLISSAAHRLRCRFRFGELSILYKAKRFASIRGEIIDLFLARHATVALMSAIN